MMIFIKRECERHRGCYTMTDKCERCIEEDFRRESRKIMDKCVREFAKILNEALA